MSRTTKMKFKFPEQETFTTKDVLRIHSPGPERFRDWTRLGYITPSVDPGGKQGQKKLFSRINIYGIGLFKRLTELGLNRWISAQFVDWFDYSMWAQVRQETARWLVIHGTPDRARDWRDSLSISLVKEIPKIESAIVLLIDLQNIVNRVDSAIG
jgi:hypothetical protein